LGRVLGVVMAVWGLCLTGCQTTAPMPEFGGLPQETSFYLDRPEVNLAADEVFQKEQYARFLGLMRSPWAEGATGPSLEETQANFRELRDKGGYGENLRPRSAAWFEQMWLLADLDGYPNQKFQAVTVAETDLRSLPTARPIFDAAQGSGGYPFDRLQLTRLSPGTPLLALHLSRDGAWALVYSHLTWGWVPRRDIARLRPEQLRHWRSDRFAAVVKDGAQLRDDEGHLLFLANVGAVLPLVSQDFNEFQVMAPVAGDGGWAVIKQVSLRADAAVAMPMPLSAANVALVANQFMNQPYGWGGYLGDRDCSALVRDLYVPFGLWLPRNSAEQARQAGQLIGLAGAGKGEVLSGQGLPFLSLVYLPGHIMIYAGQWAGQHAVLHSVWNLSSSQGQGQGPGQEGPVGRVVISPLAEGGRLWQRSEGLVILVPPERLAK
jgi:cell wall-associated NlpC family hydrolase